MKRPKKAELVREGPDRGLYDIPKGSCLCEYEQGPCYWHASTQTKVEDNQQTSLWDKLG